MMTEQELRGVKAPFKVIYTGPGRRKQKPITVTGFTEHDPLGVGVVFGGHATAYFEGGGWLLVSDLLRYYALAESKSGERLP